MHGGDAAIQAMEKDAKNKLQGATLIERNGILNEIGEAKKRNAQRKQPPPQARKPMTNSSMLILVDKEREFKKTLVASLF